MSISLIVGLVGSIALAVTGLKIAADAFGVAVGRALRTDLWRWTGSRRAAFGSGVLAGALLPADEPRTRTLSGLAGSGLLQGARGSWILLGGMGGGAVLVWLTLALGRGEILRLGALTGVALGGALRLGLDGPRKAWGNALAGVSLAALGMHLAGVELARWGASSTYPGLDVALGVRILLGAISGAALAAALRSGSLAAGLIALAASAEVLHPASALTWLIGVPLGAGLPGFLIWREANGEARRFAAAALVQSTAASLATLGLFFISAPFLGHMPGAFRDAGLVTALAYTGSLGVVALAWMAFDRMVIDWIAGRTPDTEDIDAHPGRDLEVVPELLRAELVETVQRGSAAIRALARDVLGGGGITEFRASEERASAQSMVHFVEGSASRLAARPLTPDLVMTPVELPTAARAQKRICEALLSFRTRHALGELPLGSPIVARIRQVQLAVLHLIEGSDPYHRRFSPRELQSEQEGVQAQLRDVRLRLIAETTRGALEARALEELIDRLQVLGDLGTTAAESGRALARVLSDSTRGLAEPESSPAATAPPADVEEPTAALPTKRRLLRRRSAAEAVPAATPIPPVPSADIPESWGDLELPPHA